MIILDIFLPNSPRNYSFHPIGTDKEKKLGHIIVNVSLSINLTFVLGAQKNCLNETVLLSTNNIYFG